ncbi:hypothetical protein [Legionella brunensis]|uniref:Uncharacterized protein n=1 Tax=Legionella brunensis TaxID=29422 RepID=A0A0W0SDP2_9GAMM|nr:hypothetical protein [Legionella brunensis]KTC81526.1 hypothetical protein Lbru_2046 [Legionella brunensis]
MIKTKIIKGDRLLKIYQKKYISLAHNNVDLEYFKQSKVRVFFRDSEEKMIAGFCLNSGPNYRTFLPLTSTQLQQINQSYRFNKRPPHEISCLWIEQNSQHAGWVVFLFLVMMVDMLRLNRGALIFGTHGKNVNNYFAFSLPKIIFYEKLFVATKGEVCDFWIRKGSKFQIIKGFIVLATIRLILGYRALAKFRLRHYKDKSN